MQPRGARQRFDPGFCFVWPLCFWPVPPIIAAPPPFRKSPPPPQDQKQERLRRPGLALAAKGVWGKALPHPLLAGCEMVQGQGPRRRRWRPAPGPPPFGRRLRPWIASLDLPPPDRFWLLADPLGRRALCRPRGWTRPKAASAAAPQARTGPRPGSGLAGRPADSDERSFDSVV